MDESRRKADLKNNEINLGDTKISVLLEHDKKKSNQWSVTLNFDNLQNASGLSVSNLEVKLRDMDDSLKEIQLLKINSEKQYFNEPEPQVLTSLNSKDILVGARTLYALHYLFSENEANNSSRYKLNVKANIKSDKAGFNKIDRDFIFGRHSKLVLVH